MFLYIVLVVKEIYNKNCIQLECLHFEACFIFLYFALRPKWALPRSYTLPDIQALLRRRSHDGKVAKLCELTMVSQDLQLCLIIF